MLLNLDLRRSDHRKPRKTPPFSALTRLAAYPKTIYRTRLYAIVICSERRWVGAGGVKKLPTSQERGNTGVEVFEPLSHNSF
jgi:hypothetical protein